MIEILSDHKNLEIFKEAWKLSCHQACWALFLTRFDFTITHVPGKSMGKSDALSRCPDHDTGENDNEDQILLPPTIFARSLVTIDLQDHALCQRIKDCQALDEELIQMLQIIQANGSSRWKRKLQPHWSVQDGLVLYSGRICLPKDRDLRQLVISLAHDTMPAGHPGCIKTFNLVQRQYWW